MKTPDFVLMRKQAFRYVLTGITLTVAGIGCMTQMGAPIPPSPDTFSLANDQTPIRNQVDRDTCWAFGMVAAVEAAYKREYGLSLDLSEQYAFHIPKAGELYPSYFATPGPHENNSSFWGAQGNSYDVLKLTRFALPEEQYAPYRSQKQLDSLRKAIPETGKLDGSATQDQIDAFEFSEPHIPSVARQNARYQVLSAKGLETTEIARLEYVISTKHEIIADFDLNWKWNASLNAYERDTAPEDYIGDHVMLVVGYDRKSQIFELKNSWGGEQLTRVTYDLVANQLRDGAYITAIAPPDAKPDSMPLWLGKWSMTLNGVTGDLIIRRFTDFRNDQVGAVTKLGNFIVNGSSYDVTGYFEEHGTKMLFTVASNTQRMNPTQLNGTPISVSIDPNSYPLSAIGNQVSMTKEYLNVAPTHHTSPSVVTFQQ